MVLSIAFLGAIVAGCYGIVHDHVTYSISPEYFTKVKFQQFRYADFRIGDRAFVSSIGFLATWWVGFAIAWFLARRLIPNQPRTVAYRQIAMGFALVLACGMLSAAAGFSYGLWRGPAADYSSWAGIVARHQVTDIYAFVRVAYIHNASYLGGLLGVILALIIIRPQHHPKSP